MTEPALDRRTGKISRLGTQTRQAVDLRKAAEGKKLILIIDEAHNLSSDVLEQVRLLSNLETTRQKLLQILLIGQPELDDILESPEMRQLEQRISLRYHLTPLTLEETRQYIDHRVSIASKKAKPIFTPRALKYVFKYAAGIPRLVNIACDRALLIAFCAEKGSVTRSIVRNAVNELSARGQYYRERPLLSKPVFSIIGIVLGVVAIGLFVHTNLNIPKTPQTLLAPDRQALLPAPSPEAETAEETREPVSERAQDPPISERARDPSISERAQDPASISERAQDPSILTQPQAPSITSNPGAPDEAEPEPAMLAEKVQPDNQTAETVQPEIGGERSEQEFEEAADLDAELAVDLETVLAGLDSRQSGLKALQATLALWRADPSVSLSPQDFNDTFSFFTLAAREKKFMVQRLDGDLSLIARLNLPAILAFKVAENDETVYLTAGRMENDFLVLEGVQPPLRIESTELVPYWTGEAYVLWKDFFDIQGTIPGKHTAGAVFALKMLLRNIGFSQLKFNGKFDAETREAVKSMQSKHGVDADGIVGAMTKIILYNEMKTFQMPHLMRAEG